MVNILYLLVIFTMVYGIPLQPTLNLVSREGWQAKPPKHVDMMPNPVPFVVIHHTYIPAACYNETACIKSMQWIQRFHQDDRGWNDIGYSFAVGGDGRVYTGRGWDRVGAHAPLYNNRSIGICLIGDWRSELPPENMLQQTHLLIKQGVQDGHIQQDYYLIGHRQVRDTECPGDALYGEIQTWKHYCATPEEPDKCGENFI